MKSNTFRSLSLSQKGVFVVLKAKSGLGFLPVWDPQVALVARVGFVYLLEKADSYRSFLKPRLCSKW
jgi:hypothetical protein